MAEKAAAEEKLSSKIATLRSDHLRAADDNSLLQGGMSRLLRRFGLEPADGGARPLVAQLPQVVDRAQEMSEGALLSGSQVTFAVFGSHYENLASDVVQHGFAPGVTRERRVELMEESAEFASVLTSDLHDTVGPRSLGD